MIIAGKQARVIQFDQAGGTLQLLDQTRLPFEITWLSLDTLEQACIAIRDMQVRGAPAIGAVAAWGMVFAVRQGVSLESAASQLSATRPTAVNLAWAVNIMCKGLENCPADQAYKHACQLAQSLCDQEVAACESIGNHGLTLFEEIASAKTRRPLNILTHCNAGGLATIDWGTALAPVYKAKANGLDVHVWVDETGPRYQGARLTTFELKENGIDFTLISDNAGGQLMQRGEVDLCIVGCDRMAANGDVCNKIGTYLKALAAKANNVPFYVALPVSTIDWSLESGDEIPIEERDKNEVLYHEGVTSNGMIDKVRIAPESVAISNLAFDVTPAELVTAIITEHGVFTKDSLDDLKVLGKQ